MGLSPCPKLSKIALCSLCAGSCVSRTLGAAFIRAGTKGNLNVVALYFMQLLFQFVSKLLNLRFIFLKNQVSRAYTLCV